MSEKTASSDDAASSCVDTARRCRSLSVDIGDEIARTLKSFEALKQTADLLKASYPGPANNSPPLATATTLDAIADLLLTAHALANVPHLGRTKRLVETALFEVGRQIACDLSQTGHPATFH